jgi:hypothetical protein
LKSKHSLPVLLLLAASVIFMSACSFNGIIPAIRKFAPALQPTAAPQSAQPTPANPPPAAVPAQPAGDDVSQAVKTAWAKLEAAGPRHISQTVYASDLPVMNLEVDNVAPNYHQVISALGQDVAEQYLYDGAIYNKMNGQWTRLPGGGTAFKSLMAGLTAGLSEETVTANGKVLGAANINGKPATGYSYTTTVKGMDIPPITHTLWVDNASGLPVKHEMVKADLGKTVETYTYDDNLKITLPDEAKNALTAQ